MDDDEKFEVKIISSLKLIGDVKTYCNRHKDDIEVTSKNPPSARPANQIQRISLNLTTGSGCDGAIGFL
jgi:hypothetical protein